MRYDGRHKRDAWIVEVLGPEVEWVPVCPEVEAGFGTPREAMELVAGGGADVALVTTSTGRDLTLAMRLFAERRVSDLLDEHLDGYVLKSESPSCGVDDVPRRGGQSAAAIKGPGLFAETLIARLPTLPITDEKRLADFSERQSFVARVHAHRRSREDKRSPGSRCMS